LKLGIIGGSGVYDPYMIKNAVETRVETPYGMIIPLTGWVGGREVVFLPRHGAGHSLPPHRINYQANIWGLRALGVERIIATAAVGSLNEKMSPGDLVVIDQFIDFTKNRRHTFFEGDRAAGVVHVDCTEPYCPEVRKTLVTVAGELNISCHEQGVYVCTEGPRFETPAEIAMFKRLGGDLVGMTGFPEAVLAREAGMCYAAVGMVTNFAAGMAGEPLTHEEVLAVMAENTGTIQKLLAKTLARISENRRCFCRRAGQSFDKIFGTEIAGG